MNTEPLTTLKGIGEKTEKLFAKVGMPITAEKCWKPSRQRAQAACFC